MDDPLSSRAADPTVSDAHLPPSPDPPTAHSCSGRASEEEAADQRTGELKNKKKERDNFDTNFFHGVCLLPRVAHVFEGG